MVSFHQFAHETAKSVNLIDQIENDGNRFIVDAEIVPQIAYQSRSRQVDMRKLVDRSASTRSKPAELDPCLENRGIELRLRQEFAGAHSHASTDACE